VVGLCIDRNLEKVPTSFLKRSSKKTERLPKLLLVTLLKIIFIIIKRNIERIQSKQGRQNGNKNDFYNQLTANCVSFS